MLLRMRFNFACANFASGKTVDILARNGKLDGACRYYGSA